MKAPSLDFGLVNFNPNTGSRCFLFSINFSYKNFTLRGVRMKQIISLLLSLFLIVTFSGCHNSVDTGDMPPMIDMYGQKYVAPNMPVNELPQGYTYLGELSKEQANGTGLEGCKMYAVTELDSIPDFYLYQECGTPIDDNTVDSEKIQWAYVQWIKVKAE